MKNSIIKFVLLSITLTYILIDSSICQQFTKYEVIVNAQFGMEDKKIGFNKNEGAVFNNFPGDFIVDQKDNIIIADNDKEQIHFFNKFGHWEKSISMPTFVDDGKSRLEWTGGTRTRMKLSLDGLNQIYINVCFGVNEYGIYKIDTNRISVVQISLNGKIPGIDKRVIGFFVSKNGIIYLHTSPVGNPLDTSNPDFAYDKNGKLLGQVDYYIENSEGDVYRLSSEHKGYKSFVKYLKGINKGMVASDQLVRESKEEHLPFGNTGSMYGNFYTFAGIDWKDNLYVTNGEITKQYDKNLNLVKDYSTPLKQFEEKNIFTDQTKLKISPNGSMYIMVVTSDEKVDKINVKDFTKLYIQILKINK